MTEGEAGRRDAFGTWCGAWLAIGLAITPAFAWLNPRGFAVVFAVQGLMMLPAFRIRDEDRPLAIVLFAALIWAAVSTLWSPFHPSRPENSVALKLALQLPLYWAFVCGARRATPKLQRVALAAFAWGTMGLGLVLLAEFVLDAALYEKIHFAFYKPIRHDLAEVAVAHTSFILALIWPLAVAAAARVRAPLWIAIPMIAGVVTASLRFKAEAPSLAVLFAIVFGLAALRWPKGGPRTLAAGAAVYSLIAPLVILGARASGRYEALRQAVEASWSMRMGYWSRAVDWTSDHPIRGWGLDASRAFSPGIILHPHDGALQVWLELGAVGAVLAAVFWWLALSRLARERPRWSAVAVTASASVYLLFAALNFGIWEEWWLALGALVAALAGLLMPPQASQASTSAPISTRSDAFAS